VVSLNIHAGSRQILLAPAGPSAVCLQRRKAGGVLSLSSKKRLVAPRRLNRILALLSSMRSFHFFKKIAKPPGRSNARGFSNTSGFGFFRTLRLCEQWFLFDRL
jgi:hypothetical protein